MLCTNLLGYKQFHVYAMCIRTSMCSVCICTGMFYYLLANIEPKYRSTLKCIQLIACVTVPDLQKYGYEMILKPFISDVNRLYEVCYADIKCIVRYYVYIFVLQGVTMTIRGEKEFIRGGVLFLLADTLAAHSIGGFKVGVEFSLRKCRMCLATKEQLSKKV